VPYDPAQTSDPADLKLFHYENGAWQDITISVDTTNTRVTGGAESFFALCDREATLPNTPASSDWSLALIAVLGLGVAGFAARRPRLN